ncbi:MAG TPA: STAS/SEC14 domain-containing protein [Methanoculleus sp.]|nr:STAS/SEC14 domain-containing protein [Methanoculleus sp.]
MHMMQWMDDSSGKIIGFVASEKLTDDDYAEYFIPPLEEAIDEYGDVRILLKFENFEGWTAGGAWEDLKLWPKLETIERIAVVGETTVEEMFAWMGKIFGLLSGTEVRYFEQEQIVDAWDWLRENPEELYREREATPAPR